MMISHKHAILSQPFSKRTISYTALLGCSTMSLTSLSTLGTGVSYATPAPSFTSKNISLPSRAEPSTATVKPSQHFIVVRGLLKIFRNVVPAAAYSVSVGGTNSVLGHLFPSMYESASIDSTAKELANDIDKIQAETKSPKVDLVGYSEGGLVTRDYITKYSKNNVQAAVSLGGAAHGTTLDGLSYVLHALPKSLQNVINRAISIVLCQGGDDSIAGSAFLHNLATYPETKAGIHYLDIATKDDIMATPYQTAWLKPVPGADVTNIEVHSIPGAAEDFDHLLYPSDPAVIKTVVQYLENKGEPIPNTHIENSTTANTVTPTAPAVQLLQ